MCGASDESLSRLPTTAVGDIPICIGKYTHANCDYGRKNKMKLSMDYVACVLNIGSLMNKMIQRHYHLNLYLFTHVEGGSMIV